MSDNENKFTKITKFTNRDINTDINTALKFSRFTIALELARRASERAKVALKNAENDAEAEKKDLNFLEKLARKGGEKFIQYYSTDTLEEALRIKEEGGGKDNTTLTLAQGGETNLQTGGRKKKRTRNKKRTRKNKKTRTKKKVKRTRKKK